MPERTTIARRGALALVVLLVSCRPPSPTPTPPTASRRVEVQGHRGCRGLRPENTLAAFEHAIRLGVDVLELDLAMTADGVLVVAHDPRVNETICAGAERLPGDARRYRDLTYAQTQVLDCGSRRNPRFPEQVPVPGQRIPRLEQVLDLLDRHPRLSANAEIKTFAEHRDWTHPPEAFARALVELLRRRSLLTRVVIQSFDAAALQAVARLAPEATLSALVEHRADAEPLLQATGARILSPRCSELAGEDIPLFQRRGIRVIAWTVNEPEEMRRLIAWGVDGIITDRPDLLLPLLRR